MIDIAKIGNDWKMTFLCIFSFFATVVVGMICILYVVMGVAGSIHARSIYEIYKPLDVSVNDSVIFVTKFGSGPLGYEYRVCDGKVQHRCSHCSDSSGSPSTASSGFNSNNRGTRRQLNNNNNTSTTTAALFPSHQRSMRTQAGEGEIVADPTTCPCGNEKYWEECADANPSVVLGDCTKAVEGLQTYAKFLGYVSIITIVLAPGMLLLRFIQAVITGLTCRRGHCGQAAESVFWTGWSVLIAVVCVPLNTAGCIVALGVNGAGCEAGMDLLDDFGFSLTSSIKTIHLVTGLQVGFFILLSIVCFSVIYAHRDRSHSSTRSRSTGYSSNITLGPVVSRRVAREPAAMDSFRPKASPIQRVSPETDLRVQQQHHMENPFEPVPTGVRPIGAASLQRQATDVTEIEFDDVVGEKEELFTTTTTRALGLELSTLPPPRGFERNSSTGEVPHWMLTRHTKAYVLRVETRTELGSNRVAARQYWCPVLWPTRWNMKIVRSDLQVPVASVLRDGDSTPSKNSSALPPHPEWYVCFEVKPDFNCWNSWFVVVESSSSETRFKLDPNKGERYFLVKKGTPLLSGSGGTTAAA